MYRVARVGEEGVIDAGRSQGEQPRCVGVGGFVSESERGDQVRVGREQSVY